MIKRINMQLIALVALLLPAIGLAQHNLADAQKDWPDLRLFKPSQLRTLPQPVKADLEKRRCSIPIFTKWDGTHNVIRGSFRGSSSHDIAVLCIAGDDMSVVVYWEGAAERGEEIRKFPADAYRMIHTMTPFVLKKRALRDQATDRLPAFDHDAIEDGPVGGVAETAYFHEGTWLAVF
ncbi:MAG: hypothetical protein ACREB3_05245 [Burkholderiales bacterium]